MIVVISISIISIVFSSIICIVFGVAVVIVNIYVINESRSLFDGLNGDGSQSVINREMHQRHQKQLLVVQSGESLV